MNHLMKVKFENLLSRQDIETIMISQNVFKVSSIIATKIYKHISAKHYNTHYYLLISKLFNDSIDGLHEDSRELLRMKYKELFESFQSKASISVYLQEVEILCQTDTETETNDTSSTTDIFTTEEKQQPKKTFKEIKKEILLKPTKKKISLKDEKYDEETIVNNIKKKEEVEEYSEVEFNDDDNEKIDKIFFS